MHPISVLVVEDEMVLRTVITHQLKGMVEMLYQASDGNEGLEMYIKHRPDLVITDIRMPVMSGLDMTFRIRELNPKARVIIMSAYSESHYFIRAIDLSVKSYLLKPLSQEKLKCVIDEQAYDILLEKKIQFEEQKRREAEATVQRNERVLQAVSEVAELLLLSSYDHNPLPQALQILGEATNVSRVYFFENFTLEGVNYSRQLFEWTSNGITTEINNPLLQALPHTDSSFTRWAKILSMGDLVFGAVSEMPEVERNVLQPQGIISIIAVPVFVGGKWYGFLGFDECLYERSWSASERSTLQTASNIIGAAIERQNTERELVLLTKTLEERVKNRTQKLQVEVNERKHAEQLLRQSEEKYRLIFENASDGIVLTIGGIITFVNPRFFQLTGYKPNLLIGRPFTDIVPEEYKELISKQMNRAEIGQNVVEHLDAELIASTGHRLWTEIKFNFVRWDDEPAVLTFITDINQRIAHESELRDLNANLELRVQEVLRQREEQQKKIMHKSRLESLGELAAGIAHEINQPVGGLSMSLDNILDELNNGNLSREYLEKKINSMFSDIERVRQIINHVRLFAREQDTEHRKPFSLNEVVSNTINLVERSYANNNITLKALHCQPDVMLYGNPVRLQQVLLNLFSNSKYAVEHKRNRSLSLAYQPEIVIQCERQADAAVIIVEDNGTGIPAEILDSIFDPFFTSKKAEEGTGLGLSISYGIISEMDGSIDVETSSDEFTRMIIRLPVFNSKKNP
jgi:PAS domain S-box-containing protein